MRVPAAALAVAATAFLAGCMHDGGPDGGASDDFDPEVPLFLLAVAVIAGVVLLAVNLSGAGRGPSPPPPPPQAPEPEGWAEVIPEDAEEAETPAPRKATTATKSVPKAPRRRAP